MVDFRKLMFRLFASGTTCGRRRNISLAYKSNEGENERG